jgi:hypothetical protein
MRVFLSEKQQLMARLQVLLYSDLYLNVRHGSLVV